MGSWVEANWLKVVAIFFVLGALAPIPYYAYFQLMNWIVVGAALMTALHAYREKNAWAAWIFILVAVVFNPVAPLYFSARVWQVADIAAAFLFVLSFFLVKPKK